VATQSVGDFFKPRRYYDRDQVLNDLKAGGNENGSLKSIADNNQDGFWKEPGQVIEVFREEPVFDGQYSNQCYSDRITEALEHFNTQQHTDFLEKWDHLVFHLPYAFHGRRIVFDNWLSWFRNSDSWAQLLDEVGQEGQPDTKTWNKAVSKSSFYKTFVANRIARGEKASSAIGNMYTASIFMSLLSLLEAAKDEGLSLSGQTIGLIAYGSGSKSKVFQGEVQAGWEEALKQVELFRNLSERKRIDVPTYEALHGRTLKSPVLTEKEHVSLQGIETEVPTRMGLRSYS
jgi:hydroxymethylglutaryl-CoA synthase